MKNGIHSKAPVVGAGCICIGENSSAFNREFPFGFEMMTDALFEAILT
jgi:hypothetical protein